jgi:hypothetical protein
LLEGKTKDDMDIDYAVASIIAQLLFVLNSNACVDEHTADQLIIYMALCAAKEGSTSTILCTPKILNDITLDSFKFPAELSYLSRHVRSNKLLLLKKSSLHIESALHVAKQMTGCDCTVVENPITNCRLITIQSSHH